MDPVVSTKRSVDTETQTSPLTPRRSHHHHHHHHKYIIESLIIILFK